MRTQADRDADLAIGRELERKDTEIDRLRSICGAALAKLDTMHVCCRETACERASDETLQDSSCDLRIVRGLIAAYQQTATEPK